MQQQHISSIAWEQNWDCYYTALHAEEVSDVKRRIRGVPGHMNAVSVVANGLRSHLTRFCPEVICHWRGFPHLGVGLSITEGKADYNYFMKITSTFRTLTPAKVSCFRVFRYILPSFTERILHEQKGNDCHNLIKGHKLEKGMLCLAFFPILASISVIG